MTNYFPLKRQRLYARRDFGCYGDGVHLDDPGLQAMWNTCRGGAYAGELEAGTYLVSTPLVPGSRLFIEGAGRQGAIIKLANTVNADVIGMAAANLSYVYLGNLTVDGNKANNLVAGSGVHINANQAVLDGIEVANCREYGISLDGVAGATGDVSLRDPRVVLCELAGIYNPNASDILIIQPDIGFNCATAVYNGGITIVANTVNITGGEIYGNSGSGVVIGGGNADVRIVGATFDNNSRNGLCQRLGAGSTARRSQVSGCLFRANSAAGTGVHYGIRLGDTSLGDNGGACQDWTIADCTFFGGGTGGDAGFPTQHKYCIGSDIGTLTGISVHDCKFQNGYVTAPLLNITGTDVIVWPNNRGYNPQATAAITPGASPYTYTNGDNYPEQVSVTGGTVSAITLAGGATGLTAGLFTLMPGQALVVTYTVAPTMRKFPL